MQLFLSPVDQVIYGQEGREVLLMKQLGPAKSQTL